MDGEFERAKAELDLWKMKAEKADDVKGRLILEKLEEDDAKTKAQQEMMDCIQKQQECQKEFTQSAKVLQDEIASLGKHRQELLDKLRRCQAALQKKKDETTKLKQKFKIIAQIPETEVNFKTEQDTCDQSESITGIFTISQRPAVVLHGGQALITFEEEKVASDILKMARCSVSCDDKSVTVKPKRITMDPAVKFEVHLDVSRNELKVSNVPPAMPEDRMKDRLEMSFSRPSRGGGEVKNVEYDSNTGTGKITFLHPGVAETLAQRGKHQVDLDYKVEVQVGSVYKYHLCKFQTFCGSPKRTVLLCDIADVMEDEEDLQDHLEIHFQKPTNNGGEIENIKYISAGKTLQAFFSEVQVNMVD